MSNAIKIEILATLDTATIVYKTCWGLFLPHPCQASNEFLEFQLKVSIADLSESMLLFLIFWISEYFSPSLAHVSSESFIQ